MSSRASPSRTPRADRESQERQPSCTISSNSSGCLESAATCRAMCVNSAKRKGFRAESLPTMSLRSRTLREVCQPSQEQIAHDNSCGILQADRVLEISCHHVRPPLMDAVGHVDGTFSIGCFGFDKPQFHLFLLLGNLFP